MSLRRFVYLVTDDAKSRDYFLRRIDMSRFFFPKGGKRDPPPLLDGCLPPATVGFRPPVLGISKGYTDFMLLGRRVCRNEKVVATDQTGRTLLYDPESCCVRTLTNLTVPKKEPISFTVGDNLYILDIHRNPERTRDQCFDVLIYRKGDNVYTSDDWVCHSLPAPPYVHAYHQPVHVISYSVVGGSNLWISKDTLGTHSFDTDRCVWTKVGDWTLPFYGCAHYVPEHGLWFGLSCGGYGEDSSMCCSDLTVTPPTARTLWTDHAQPEWISGSSHLVHLGHARFCHARFFKLRPPYVIPQRFVVFTGLEVKRCGEEVVVMKHKSVRYNIDYTLLESVI